MPSEKQLAANRRNALLSTGPRSAEGKDSSRNNAIKHGLRADNLIVLPNEDPAAYQAKVESFVEHYQPASAVEDQLVLHIAKLSWMRERADRYETVSLSKRVRDAIAGAEASNRNRVDDAYRALISEPRDYEKALDAADLLRSRAVIEGVAYGCRWLIGIWKGMLQISRAGRAWTSPQELYAMRLLTKDGQSVVRDPGLIDMAVANHMLNRPTVEMIARNWNDGLNIRIPNLLVEAACERKPANLVDAAAFLDRVAEREIARLEELIEKRVAEGDLIGEDPEEAGWLATFDPSANGERLRRYQASLSRELTRTREALAKLRREEAKAAKQGSICANEPNFEDVRQECRTHEETPADAPNEPSSLDGESGVEKRESTERTQLKTPNEAKLEPIPAPNEPNWEDRKRRKPAHQLIAQLRRADRSQSSR